MGNKKPIAHPPLDQIDLVRRRRGIASPRLPDAAQIPHEHDSRRLEQYIIQFHSRRSSLDAGLDGRIVAD